jgi:hypothetical protein
MTKIDALGAEKAGETTGIVLGGAGQISGKSVVENSRLQA